MTGIPATVCQVAKVQLHRSFCIRTYFRKIVYSHYTGTGPGMQWGLGTGPVVSNILCRNINTSLRQEQGPGPIVSYCASSIPCTASGPGGMQCE